MTSARNGAASPSQRARGATQACRAMPEASPCGLGRRLVGTVRGPGRPVGGWANGPAPSQPRARGGGHARGLAAVRPTRCRPRCRPRAGLVLPGPAWSGSGRVQPRAAGPDSPRAWQGHSASHGSSSGPNLEVGTRPRPGLGTTPGCGADRVGGEYAAGAVCSIWSPHRCGDPRPGRAGAMRAQGGITESVCRAVSVDADPRRRDHGPGLVVHHHAVSPWCAASPTPRRPRV
jgi:hypothetical protein